MSEKSEAKRDGSRLQKNSGRGKHAKGDAVLGRWLIDIKEYGKSFSLSSNVWAKVCSDAFRAGGRNPALKVVLGTDDKKVRLFVISESDFHELNDCYDQQEGVI